MSTDTEQPIVEETAPVEVAAAPAPEVVERDVESDVLEIPDSSADGGKVKYVPASALSGARSELKELKAELATAREGSAKAAQLEARIDELSDQLAQIAPKAQAYDAALAAQQYQPPQETPEERAELEEIARDFDFYKPDGALDIAKAQRHQARVRKEAQQVAQAHVAPLARHTVTQESQTMLARAKVTVAPNGAKPDPKILDAVWARLDPSLTATPDGAKQAWAVAMGYSAATAAQAEAQPAQGAQRGADGKFAKADVPDPLYTEKAGGKVGPPSVALDEIERKFLKDSGMSEKEYLESANNAPWLRK